MKTRILALLLALVLVVGMLPVTALATESLPEFKMVNMTLNGILKVNFKVASNGNEMDAYSVKVTIGDSVQNITSYTQEGELYVYTAELMAHKMHETLKVQLMNGEAAIGEEKTFTVEKYVSDMNTLYAGDAELSSLLDGMMRYGSYAEAYAAGQSLSDEIVEAVTRKTLVDYKHSIKTQSISLKAVTALYLDDACDLLVKFDAAAFAGSTLYIDGVAVEPIADGSGKVVYTIPELLPQDWGHLYNIKVVRDEATVFECNYGVLSYAYIQLGKSSEATVGMNSLLRAMYLYSTAAAVYADANDMATYIVTPNSTRWLYKDGVNNGYRFICDIDNAEIKKAVDFINTHFNELAGSKIDYPGSVDQVNWDMSKKYIVVGNHTMFAAAGLEMPNVDLGDTGYYIVTKGDSVFIMADEDADEQQAYQLAALAFLKAVVGYEMYAADCVSYTVADGQNFTLPDIKIICRPDVDYRYEGNYISVGNGSYGMGNTDNDIFIPINGNNFHTVLDLLDPNTYYADHNDWFYRYSQNDSIWDQIIGNQRYDHYQLCFSTILESQDALDIMYDNLVTAIAAKPDLHNISLGVADNNYICDCEDCQTSGVANYIKVANKLAQMLVDGGHGDIKLVCFAYRQYEDAPSGVTAHQNVGVMVAPIEAKWNTPIADQATYADQIKAWANVSDHLYIWYYQANFDNYLYPMDSWDVMQSNIQFARDNGADMIFYQNQGNNASHFSKLKDYLEAALLKDANADYNTLVNNFFANYYGPAAEPMKAYFEALQAHMDTFSTGAYKEAINTTANWPQAELQEYMGYINEAYAAVKASGAVNAGTYNSRINLESLFPRFALLSLYSDTTTAGTANNFAVDCTALGVTQYNEGTAFSDSDYSGWWNHTCSAYSEYAHDRCLVSGATEQSAAIYYKTCSACGAINPEETFTSGSPLNHDAHTYEFEAGTDENEGYDVGTCFCGETVKVKTDFSASAPVDVVNGTATTLTMPEDFAGTITQVKFGETATCAVTDGVFDTSSIPTMNHGLWASVDVTFTSEYGGTHTAQIPVTLITDVISTKAELTAFAAEAIAANSNSALLYGYYILDADIDCAGASVATGGGTWNGYGFMGTLDGRGHKISNLLVSNQGGIFGRMGQNSAVKNIHFENVVFAANTALFAKVTDRAVFTNVTVDIVGWTSVASNMTYAGILGVSSNSGNVFDNFVVNIANGVSVSNLMGAQFSGTGYITVNLYGNAEVVNYYTDSSGNVTSAEGTIITVNTIPVKNETIDTEIVIEGNTWTQALDVADGSVTVDFAGTGLAGTVTDGVLTVELSGITAAGKLTNNVVVTAGNDSYTYTNVLHVTQIIDTAAEMTAFTQLFDSANYGGYYILGADIDMNGAEFVTNEGWHTGFTGTFDGCGYTVSNFTVRTRGGIFGGLYGATVKNVIFDAVTYTYKQGTFTNETWGAALLGRTGVNATIQDVAVNIKSWNNGAMPNGGALFASVTENVNFTNVDVTLAENLAITTNFFGIGFNESTVTGDITVTLNEGSSITNWYKNSAGTVITELPAGSIITVVSLAITETTVDTFVVAEGSSTLTLTNDAFTSGAEATITLGQSSTTATAGDGTLSVNLSALGAVMGELTEDLVVTCNRNRITYTDVWYVTQVIDDAAELRAFGLSCQAGYMDGYYILGNDIDCSAYATMNVDPGWTSDNGLSGTFDGRGYEISNIKIVWTSSAASENGVGGLFSRLYGATVKNTVFNVSNLGGNGSLLARFAVKSDTSDVILENLTVNLSAYASNAEAVFVGYSMYNTQFNGVTLNVADGVTIGNLFTKNGYNGNSGTGLTVNLGAESTITSYYGNTAENAKPDFVTVNSSSRATVTETLDTLVAGEAATAVSFTHDVLGSCSSATVVINGVTQENVAIANGEIAVDLAEYGVSAMGQYSAVITTDYGDVLTYTEVWYVTQSIDTVAELKALGTSCKDSVVTGYYILGGDVDCSAEATMSNGSASTTTNGFSGTFDGRGKTISNIKMAWDSATGGLGGLFGKLLGATIKDTVFDNVNLGTNGTLLASGADKNSSTDTNTTLRNLTINLNGYSTVYGVVVGYSMFNTVGSGIVINVADGLTVAALMCRDTCNTISDYITATVNLGSGSTITTYCSGVATPPAKFTVNQK